MKDKIFWILFFVILTVSFVLRIIPPLHGNNFYFTMDQGNDAVHVREILYRHRLQLLGPETNIDGLYAGPLWYYFISIGYGLFGGHPFGAVFMVTMLNTALVALVMRKVRKEISPRVALVIGGMLQLSWWFYDASRYGFNPFPLVFLAFMLIFLLTDCLRGNAQKYIWAAIPVGLGFNTEIAGSIAFTMFYISVGIWAITRRRIRVTHFLIGFVVLSLFFIPHVVSELSTGFSQTQTLFKEIHNPRGTFSGSGFGIITPTIFLAVARSILRQIPALGVVAFAITIFLAVVKWYKTKKMNPFVRCFSILSLGLLVTTWLWFGSNKGWRDWQTIYISPVIFVTVLLLLTQIPRRIAALLLIISLVSHIDVFFQRYGQFFRPSDDPSILHNELAAIDWVYTRADGKGFYVYNYLPSVYDYPYQYLFWWYGRRAYGYVPCEYASFPGAPKLVVPGSTYYENPKRECMPVRFLIVEPDEESDERRETWLAAARRGTKLVEEENVGKIMVEKRLIE